MSTHSGTWDTGETLAWYANDEVLYHSLQGIVNVFHDATFTCGYMVRQEVATFMEGQEYFKVDLDEVDWDEVIDTIKEDLGIDEDDDEEYDVSCPYVVVLEATGHIFGRFPSEERASSYIGTLDDHKDGIYGIDNMRE